MSFDCREAQKSIKRRCIPLNKFIFRRKPSEKKEQSLLRLLLPSVLGFALCFVCLAATTWAWFVVSVTSNSNTIQTASFEVEVAVFDSNGDLVPANTDGSYTVSAGGTYTVALQKTGNAEKVYFLIKDGDTEYYTGNLAGGDVQYLFERTFTNTNVTITPKWGELPGNSPIDIGSPLALLNEDPANEDEQENQQQEEENPSDENNPADDTNTGGEGESKPDTPAEGEGGQQGDEQQPSEPSTPADGEQGGEQTDVSGDTTGGDTGDDTVTGGETPTDTPTPAGGDVPTEPVVTTDPTAQSEGGAPADPAPIE